jgi:hypothetical protein
MKGFITFTAAVKNSTAMITVRAYRVMTFFFNNFFMLILIQSANILCAVLFGAFAGTVCYVFVMKVNVIKYFSVYCHHCLNSSIGYRINIFGRRAPAFIIGVSTVIF